MFPSWLHMTRIGALLPTHNISTSSTGARPCEIYKQYGDHSFAYARIYEGVLSFPVVAAVAAAPSSSPAAASSHEVQGFHFGCR